VYSSLVAGGGGGGRAPGMLGSVPVDERSLPGQQQQRQQQHGDGGVRPSDGQRRPGGGRDGRQRTD